jgi:hypothetical protein
MSPGEPTAKPHARNSRHPSESFKDRAELETELDEGLLGTFPASDSPAVTSTVIPGAPPGRDRT